jgi:hypothetical protein
MSEDSGRCPAPSPSGIDAQIEPMLILVLRSPRREQSTRLVRRTSDRRRRSGLPHGAATPPAGSDGRRLGMQCRRKSLSSLSEQKPGPASPEKGEHHATSQARSTAMDDVTRSGAQRSCSHVMQVAEAQSPAAVHWPRSEGKILGLADRSQQPVTGPATTMDCVAMCSTASPLSPWKADPELI